eukprot:2225466-Pyramimonas_sp.AAC.1
MVGAALEHLATMVRDDIMIWAFSHVDYKEFFKQNDTPVGQDLIQLPEAGGDTRCDMQMFRSRAATVQEERITHILLMQTSATLDQREMIAKIPSPRDTAPRTAQSTEEPVATPADDNMQVDEDTQQRAT